MATGEGTLKVQKITVGDTPTFLTGSGSSVNYREYLSIFNNSAITVFVGSSNVATGSGYPIPAAFEKDFPRGATPPFTTFYGIVANGATADVRVMEI